MKVLFFLPLIAAGRKDVAEMGLQFRDKTFAVFAEMEDEFINGTVQVLLVPRVRRGPSGIYQEPDEYRRFGGREHLGKRLIRS